ncbi:glutaminase A [Hazenella sp. IB182357]|uniref:Glutaminase n=1 Tax=Polycladospora coralii TaxID=2771432 RepID=A0A926RSC6_9BACL|nr:glutaminase A [Polycladospora coralii]MBD1370950.1 glutaminase A [Polycladospora coralii]MBS7529889.1 glutaminase A [Polycladospora coralii]
MKNELQQLVEKYRPLCEQGKLADYIPVLGKQDPRSLGITVMTADGQTISAGMCPTQFTLQSISKVITLILAIMDCGEEEVFSKVGMEPTGDPFNSIYKMEVFAHTRPLNPMINAGAMVVSSLIKGDSIEQKVTRIIALVKQLTGISQVGVMEEVYESELEHAHRNRALVHIIKEMDLIKDVDMTLHTYLRQCAIRVDCEGLAKIGLCLAQDGKNEMGEQIIKPTIARLAKTFMVTCGMYNASGEFAIRVGIPAKSGVSGGILAAVPHKMGIGIVGPALDQKGNSIGGVALLTELAKRWNLSIF